MIVITSLPAPSSKHNSIGHKVTLSWSQQAVKVRSVWDQRLLDSVLSQHRAGLIIIISVCVPIIPGTLAAAVFSESTFLTWHSRITLIVSRAPLKYLLESVGNVHVHLRSSLISTKFFYKSVPILLLPHIQISAISPERVTVAYHEGVNGCPPSDGEVMSPVCPEHDRQCWLHWVGQPHLPVPPHWHNHLVRDSMTCLYDNIVQCGIT